MPNQIIAAVDAEVEAERIATEAQRKKEQDQKLIDKWIGRLKHGRAHDADARKKYALDRKYGRGDTEWLVDTNLIGAIMEVLQAFIYAKNPDVNVRPSDAVGEARLHKFSMVAKTIEVVLSRLLKAAGLKTQAKRWVRSAMTVGIGWLKATIKTRTEIDPIVEKKINSLEDNIKRLDQMQADYKAGLCADAPLTEAEIRGQIEVLQSQKERQVADGAVIDFIAADDVLVSPECGELENYLAAPWIAFDSYKLKDEARLLCDWPDTDEYRECLKTANIYSQRPRRGDDNTNEAPTQNQWVQINSSESEAADGFVKITEIWSLRDGLVFTLIDGIREWARQPYAPRTGSRFYPGFQLAFHYNDSDRHPQSDVHLLKKLQDEFGRTRSNYAEHRRRAVMATLFDKTQLTPESVDAITKATTQEFIGVETTNGAPLQNVFTSKPVSPIDPGLYSTEQVRVEMEKMSGAQDAQQGSVAVEKTLGEAKIQQSGFMARTGARRDFLEDVLGELCEYLAQIALQVMDSADAIRYAGDEAVWAQLSVEEALTLFDFEIKPGSTGKPQDDIDKQTWGTLLPLMQQMIDRIAQARIKQQEWAAKPWIALLRETARRLGDRIDVDALLPVPPPPPTLPGAEGAAGGPVAALLAAAGGGGAAPGADAAVPSPAAPDPGAATMQ